MNRRIDHLAELVTEHDEKLERLMPLVFDHEIRLNDESNAKVMRDVMRDNRDNNESK